MFDSGINNNTLKVQNRKLILRLLTTGQCSSRIDIARETGLSKMAASNIISEFINEGIIQETEKQQVCGKGRNPILLDISPTAPKILGIHIGRKSCEASICNLKLETLKISSEILPEDDSLIMETVFRIADEILIGYENEKILGIGVGAAGPVDTALGKIMFPPTLGIPDIVVVDKLEERYDLPVIFLNEHDCAAITELYFGKGRNLQEFYFIGISDRIGAGIVSRGELYRSRSGFNCEFGHTCIDYKGILCYCGRKGCVDAYTSIIPITAKIKEASGEDLTFEEFCHKYEKDAPPEIDAIFEEMVTMLSYGIKNTATLSCTMNYIIGCEGCYIPDRYIESCNEKINELIVLKDRRKVNIVKSDIHREISPSSCACAVLDMLLSRES